MCSLICRMTECGAHLNNIDPVQRVAEHQEDVPLSLDRFPGRRYPILRQSISPLYYILSLFQAESQAATVVQVRALNTKPITSCTTVY